MSVGLRALMAGAAVALLAAGLGGCGRRGGLEPALDPGAPALAAGRADETVSRRHPKVVPITPPHEPFILDPLL